MTWNVFFSDLTVKSHISSNWHHLGIVSYFIGIRCLSIRPLPTSFLNGWKDFNDTLYVKISGPIKIKFAPEVFMSTFHDLWPMLTKNYYTDIKPKKLTTWYKMDFWDVKWSNPHVDPIDLKWPRTKMMKITLNVFFNDL